ncbi:MAG TPA: LytR C-terminal domain-containing protein [Gemmatimonadaceae bacterium]|nr:LytR C-terminal domain-containing protein [Gemmatimonadaceae bacterium]
MKIGRWILLALVLVGAGAYGVRVYRGNSSLPFRNAEAEAPSVLVPPGVRIKVEVLNATNTRGLARRATLFLRDRGFDVVAVGTAREQLATTLVLDRSNHPEWARLVAQVFNAKMEQRLDSSRYLDVTVLVGAEWRPPALPFYP